jgi:hypothetical protein
MCLLLITRGCDANIRDDFGNNASYWAKKNNYTELLQFLPPPMIVLPTEVKEYRDLVDFHVKGEDKKKNKKKK